VLIYLILSYILLCFSFFFAVAATSARDSSDTILCDLLWHTWSDAAGCRDFDWHRADKTAQNGMVYYRVDQRIVTNLWPQISMLLGEYPSLSLCFLASQSNSMVDKQGKWTSRRASFLLQSLLHCVELVSLIGSAGRWEPCTGWSCNIPAINKKHRMHKRIHVGKSIS